MYELLEDRHIDDVCSLQYDLSFLPFRFGGIQVNDLNNRWLSRQTYILSQMSEEIVLYFPGKCDLKSCESLHKLLLEPLQKLHKNKEQNSPISPALFLHNTSPSILVKIYEKSRHKNKQMIFAY